MNSCQSAVSSVIPNRQQNIPSYSKPSNQLVTQGLSLGDGTETSCSNFLCIQLDRALGKAEPLLHNGRQLSDATSFLAQNILRPRCKDYDFGTCRRHTDFNTAVTIFSQLAREKLIQLSLENPILNKLQNTDTALTSQPTLLAISSICICLHTNTAGQTICSSLESIVIVQIQITETAVNAIISFESYIHLSWCPLHRTFWKPIMRT